MSDKAIKLSQAKTLYDDLRQRIDEKYEKPSSGIPASDLAAGVIPDVSGKADMDLIARDYSDLTFPVVAGTHCIHEGGYYEAKAEIATSEEWTAAHWLAIPNIGSELGTFKSALNAFQLVPRTANTDEQNIDLDVTDSEGNVLVRFAGGGIQTKEFDSTDIGDLSGLSTTAKSTLVEAVNELASGKVSGNQGSENAGKVLQVGNDGTVAPADAIPDVDDTLTVEGDAADAQATGEAIHFITERSAILTADDEDNADFDVTDQGGNVLVRFDRGHMSTSKFSSKLTAETVPTDATDSDLDIVDEGGSVLLRLRDGFIQTKYLNLNDPYILPSYYDGYLEPKIYRINQLMKETGGDTFIFCTDQHMKSNSHQSYKLIRRVHKECRVNKLFMGGDLINGIYEPWAKEFRDAMDGRCYFMGGNHDYMGGSTTEENIAYSLTSALDDEVSGDPMRRYYWIDNPNQKIRYICTNSFKSNAAHTSWDWGFEEAQMTWLTGTAMNVPSGWGCIIMSHMFWNGVSESEAGLVLPGTGSGNPWDGDMKAALNAIDAANTNNQVLAIIQGHTHQDGIKVTDGGIPILIVTADRHNFDDGDEPYMDCRVPGTTKEQAFDVCIVDRVNGKLYAVRIGGYNTGDAEEEAALETAGERVINI